jgi:hypothetical protein
LRSRVRLRRDRGLIGEIRVASCHGRSARFAVAASVLAALLTVLER